MVEEPKKDASSWLKALAACGAGMGIGFGTCAMTYQDLVNGSGSLGPIAIMGAVVFCLCAVGLLISIVMLILNAIRGGNES